ncbi:MAG: SDR family oxidoreductase [Xanthomonadaceae bacterium]|nr:SDR family oxidoreductase [Xanthomonadaceae bacterium]
MSKLEEYGKHSFMNRVQSSNRCLVTGASSGIGAATAIELGRQGYKLCLVARRKDRLEEVRLKALEAGSPEVEVLALDLLDEKSTPILNEQAERTDVLINNAGIGTLAHALDTPIETHLKTVTLNAVRVMEHSHYFALKMRERGYGLVINISSLAAFQSIPYLASYSASKAFVVQWGESLDSELAGTGVRIVSFCPGGTWTEFMDTAGYSAAEVKKISRWMQSSEEVALEIVKCIKNPRAVVIPGATNQLTYALQKMLPRSWLTRSGKKIYSNLMRK